MNQSILPRGLEMETQIDRRIALPPAKYDVKQTTVTRGSITYHQYLVTESNGKIHKLKGATTPLSVISKQPLIKWSADKAAEDIGFALTARLQGAESKKIVLTEEWIAGILEDARKAPDKNKNAAADIGSQAHEYIDQFIRGEDPDTIPEKIVHPIEAWKEWFAGSNLTIVAGETMVASLEYQFGGELDFLARGEEGEFVIGDWKNTSGVYNEHALQAGGAYRQAFKETYGIDCSRAVIVRFDKTEKHYGDYNGQEAFAEWAETKNGTGFVLRASKGKRPLIYKTFPSVAVIPGFKIIPDRDKVGFEVKEVRDLKMSLKGFLLAKELKENIEDEHFCF